MCRLELERYPFSWLWLAVQVELLNGDCVDKVQRRKAEFFTMNVEFSRALALGMSLKSSFDDVIDLSSPLTRRSQVHGLDRHCPREPWPVAPLRLVLLCRWLRRWRLLSLLPFFGTQVVMSFWALCTVYQDFVPDKSTKSRGWQSHTKKELENRQDIDLWGSSMLSVACKTIEHVSDEVAYCLTTKRRVVNVSKINNFDFYSAHVVL